MVTTRVILSLLRRRRKPTITREEIAPKTLTPPTTVMPTEQIPEPIMTPIRRGGGGGGGGEDVPQQTFATAETLRQSIPISEPQFTPIPTPTPSRVRGGVTITEQVLIPEPISPIVLPIEEPTVAALSMLPTRGFIPLSRFESERLVNGIEPISIRRRTRLRRPSLDINGLSFTEIITTGLQRDFSFLPREGFQMQVPTRVKKIRKKTRIKKKSKKRSRRKKR